MSRKGSQPALYELIRSRPAERSGTAAPRALPPATIEPAPSLSAGLATAIPTRALRVPVGYLYAGAAVILLAVVASYLYGVSVGDRVARDRLAQQRLDEMQAAGRLPAADPLAAGRLPGSLRGGSGESPGSGGPTTPPSGGTAGPTANPKANPNAGSKAGANGALGPPPQGDPRQAGLNYFVLAHTPAREGEVLVDFCRANGLDAHLVPDDNGRLRLVIVLPGFAGGERQSAAVKDLESKIRAVGLRWKNTARGNRDFGDAYPKKYQPK